MSKINQTKQRLQEERVRQAIRALPHDTIYSHGDRRVVVDASRLETLMLEAICVKRDTP